MEKFSTIVKEMKVVIFDMYGVINFGSGVSPTVLQALKTLREDGKIVIILSNASFGSADAVSKYAKKGIFKGVHYDDVVTSGQFGYEAIQRGDVPVPGTTMYVFGTANFKRPEDKLPDLFKDSVYSVTEDMEKADFAYCGVPQIHGEDRMDINDFIPELEKIRKHNLEMVCANPDLRANEGGKFVVRQGLICQAFRQMGGKTVIYGKPDPKIFDRALRGFENVSKEHILMVGDTLQTDILGANRAGIKSCLVVEGGVTEYTILQQGKDVNDKTVMSLIETQQIYPDFVCPKVTEGKLF